MLQQSICKEADDFLGVCNKTGRRYLDPVILMLNSDDLSPITQVVGVEHEDYGVQVSTAGLVTNTEEIVSFLAD
eukprot:664842-Prorocentrum_minimum.AAC.1